MTACDQERLLLIDGHAAAYRFFYGIRPMSTRSGIPVQAVFGFIRMMQQFQRQLYPTYQAVAFDGGLPQSRLDLVPDYKAQRKPMPEELRVQLPILQEYLTAAGIPCFCLEAIEADDVIATFARQFDGLVYIGTSDKDMYQLVCDTISIIPLSGALVALDAAGVLKKTGVTPAQIADWLALTGDTADNIPGVPGVGPKTAASLLQQFGSLSALFDRVDEVKREGVRKALQEHAEIVWRNREMVLLHQVDSLPEVKTLRNQALPSDALRAFYEKYEFESYAQSLRSPELF